MHERNAEEKKKLFAIDGQNPQLAAEGSNQTLL